MTPPTKDAATGTEGAPLATKAAPPGGPAPGFPSNVNGKGDVAVRHLNQDELNRTARGRP